MLGYIRYRRYLVCSIHNIINEELKMSIDRIVLAFAGGVITTSLLLALKVSTSWLWLTAFVGVNLLQSAFTGFCPLANILKKMGFKPGEAFA